MASGAGKGVLWVRREGTCVAGSSATIVGFTCCVDFRISSFYNGVQVSSYFFELAIILSIAALLLA